MFSQIAALGVAVLMLPTGRRHRVEVWSGEACWVSPRQAGQVADRFAAATRVISAGEPLDLGRVTFALGHPAMLRRLWFGVWDSAEPAIAERKRGTGGYGSPPYGCERTAGPTPTSCPPRPLRAPVAVVGCRDPLGHDHLRHPGADQREQPALLLGAHRRLALSAPPTSRSASSPPPRPGRRQPARKGRSAR